MEKYMEETNRKIMEQLEKLEELKNTQEPKRKSRTIKYESRGK